MRRFVLGLWTLPLLAATAAAQDRQHWSQQYGTRSGLLGGAVVSSSRDTSASFYNPGAIGFINESSVSVSGNAYGMQSLTIEDGVGTGDDMVASDYVSVPTLLAGLIRFGEDDEHSVVYSILTRQHLNVRITSRGQRTYDVLQNHAGTENYIGQFDAIVDTDESWAGLSYAYKLHPNISIGVTGYATLRSNLFSVNARAEARNPTDFAIGQSSSFVRHDFLEFALLAKIGIAVDLAPFTFGITFTTPSMHSWGAGDVDVQQLFSGIDIDSNGTDDAGTLNVRQENRDARWHRAASLAVGASWKLEDWHFHLTVEWFGGVGRYSVMRLEPDPNAPGLQFRVEHAERGVANVGVAVEYAFSESIGGYFSIRSDKSAGPDDSDSDVTIADWDLVHVTIGASFRSEHSAFGVGIGLSGGTNDRSTQPVNFGNATEADFLMGSPTQAELGFGTIWLYLGYTYYI